MSEPVPRCSPNVRGTCLGPKVDYSSREVCTLQTCVRESWEEVPRTEHVGGYPRQCPGLGSRVQRSTDPEPPCEPQFFISSLNDPKHLVYWFPLTDLIQFAMKAKQSNLYQGLKIVPGSGKHTNIIMML